MVPEKTINIPFNYDHFVQCRRAYRAYYAKKFYGRNTWFSIMVIVLFLVVQATNDGKEIGALQIMSGLLIYVLMIWLGFFERHFKFIKQYKAQAKQLQNAASATATYTFTPDRIIYTDHEKSYSLNWQLFKPFEVYKNHILLTLKDNGALLFILGRQEFGDENYFAIQEILKEKTGDLLMRMSDAKKVSGREQER